MTLPEIKGALWRAYTDISRNHSLQMAAALSYYFVLSLFPALIFLSAIVAYLPVPDLFNQSLLLMSHFLPADAMGLVRRVLADVITPNKGTFLSLGCWIGLSDLLRVYFRHFANFNKTYGTLGAAVALMMWLYWTGFAMLVGAELNSELAKITKKGKLQEKQQASSITRIDLAA